MILLNECREFFRDRTNIFFTMAFPLILILLLGNMLNNQNVADSEVGYLKTGILIESKLPMDQVMIETFLSNINNTGSIEMAKYSSKEAAMNQVAAGELDGFVIFKDDVIEIYEGDDLIKNRTFSAIINGFLQNRKAIISILSNRADNSVGVDDDSLNQVMTNKSYTTKRDFDKNRSMIDYYGVCMIILIVGLGGIAGFSSFGNERKNKTINRLIASPMSRTQIFLQKVLGMMLTSTLEIAVIMLVGTTFFGVNYANNIGDNILLFTLFFVSMMMMGCIGVAFSLCLKGNPLFIFGPILWLMMFFSGTFSKELYIESISPYMPMYQLQQVAFGLISFGHREKVIIILGIELIIIAVCSLLGIVRFNKIQEER